MLLAEHGALAEAEAAFRRADERGDAVAAFNLGVLLEERGALPEAEAAYRRAGAARRRRRRQYGSGRAPRFGPKGRRHQRRSRHASAECLDRGSCGPLVCRPAADRLGAARAGDADRRGRASATRPSLPSPAGNRSPRTQASATRPRARPSDAGLGGTADLRVSQPPSLDRRRIVPDDGKRQAPQHYCTRTRLETAGVARRRGVTTDERRAGTSPRQRSTMSRRRRDRRAPRRRDRAASRRDRQSNQTRRT